MTETEKDKQAKVLAKSFNRLRKAGLIVDVAGIDGIQTMLTAKGFEVHKVLSLFIPDKETDPTGKTKTKRSGQDKMDSAIKTIVQVGAGISELMQGLGKLAGDPVKMDMSQAGIDLGQGKPKKKQTYKKGKQRRNKQ